MNKVFAAVSIVFTMMLLATGVANAEPKGTNPITTEAKPDKPKPLPPVKTLNLNSGSSDSQVFSAISQQTWKRR